MSGNEIGKTAAAAEALGETTIPSVRAVVVGDPREWHRKGRDLPRDTLVFIGIEDVTPEMLDELQPDIIYSPLLAKTFDCIDLAMQLHKIGYEGAYRAKASDVPVPAMIEREVQQLCPQLDFEIIERL